MWVNDWIGLPYADLGRGPEAFDCLGLFLALQRVRFGREIPDPACSVEQAVRRGVVEARRSDVIRVAQAQEGDALLFYAHGRPLHLGFALNNQDMLHIDSIAGSRVERWRAAAWLGKLEGIYRFA